VEQVAGRVPVYAGASEITTRQCIRLAELAESIGVDALWNDYGNSQELRANRDTTAYQ
ncbi:hypothetical protein LCGC14_2476840, partial [marine sediment metagenome]